jgi:hypothetical protein
VKDPAIVVGIGEIGATFARGLLRTGRTVVPLTRESDPGRVFASVADPSLVLVTVGEDDLAEALASVPVLARRDVALVQNELRPRAVRALGVGDPTYAIVWFEKKRGIDVKVLRPTVLVGPRAAILEEALRAISVPCRIAGLDQTEHELCLKNLYILTCNIAGLAPADMLPDGVSTVGPLFEHHHDFALALARELFAVEKPSYEGPLSFDALREELEEAAASDPTHGLRGRVAVRRLNRALERARVASVETPLLDQIAKAQ